MAKMNEPKIFINEEGMVATNISDQTFANYEEFYGGAVFTDDDINARLEEVARTGGIDITDAKYENWFGDNDDKII